MNLLLIIILYYIIITTIIFNLIQFSSVVLCRREQALSLPSIFFIHMSHEKVESTKKGRVIRTCNLSFTASQS